MNDQELLTELLKGFHTYRAKGGHDVPLAGRAGKVHKPAER